MLIWVCDMSTNPKTLTKTTWAVCYDFSMSETICLSVSNGIMAYNDVPAWPLPCRESLYMTLGLCLAFLYSMECFAFCDIQEKTCITLLLLVFRHAHLYSVLGYIMCPARRTHQRCAQLAHKLYNLTTKSTGLFTLSYFIMSCHSLCLRILVVTSSNFLYLVWL